MRNDIPLLALTGASMAGSMLHRTNDKGEMYLDIPRESKPVKAISGIDPPSTGKPKKYPKTKLSKRQRKAGLK